MPKKLLLFCLALLSISFILLFILSPDNGKDEKVTEIFNQQAGSSRYVSSINYHRKQEKDGNYIITYGFIDYTSKKQMITFKISKLSHRELDNKFGYNNDEVEKRANSRIRIEIDTIINKAGVSKYINYTLNNKRISVNSDPVPSEIYSRVKNTMNKVSNYYSNNYNAIYGKEIEKHGFYVEGNYIKINYKTLVDWSHKSLRDCFDSLYNAGKGYSKPQYLGLFVAFMQEINYKIPPDIIKGKNTGGIFIPTDVLINNRGDCDSKSIAFSALWKYFTNSSVIIIQVHNHVLVGVAVTPEPGQAYSRIGNTYYVLCEVAGPGKIYPGYDHSVKGTFNYYLIN